MAENIVRQKESKCMAFSFSKEEKLNNFKTNNHTLLTRLFRAFPGKAL